MYDRQFYATDDLWSFFNAEDTVDNHLFLCNRTKYRTQADAQWPNSRFERKNVKNTDYCENVWFTSYITVEVLIFHISVGIFILNYDNCFYHSLYSSKFHAYFLSILTIKNYYTEFNGIYVHFFKDMFEILACKYLIKKILLQYKLMLNVLLF